MRFTHVSPLKNILTSRLYFHDWMINHIRFRECDAAIMQDTSKIIKISCICMNILLVYTHLDPSNWFCCWETHGRFWFHCEPIERQGSPGWKVDWLTIYASNVETNTWTLLSKTQAFSIWEIEHIQHLETTCGDFFQWTYMIYMYLTCAYIRIY